MLSIDILERLEQRLDEAQSAFSLARQALRVEFVQCLKTGNSKVPTNEETTPSEFMIKSGQNLRKTFFQQFGRNVDIEDLHQLLQAALEELPEEHDLPNVRSTKEEKPSQRQTSLEDEKEREPTRTATEDRQQAVDEFHCLVAQKFRKVMGRNITEEEQQGWIEQFGNMRFVDAEFPSDGESDDSDFNPDADAEQEQLFSDIQEDEENAEDHEEAEPVVHQECEDGGEETVDSTTEKHREIISRFMHTEFGSDEDDPDYEPESGELDTESETSEFSGQEEDEDEDEDDTRECPKQPELQEEDPHHKAPQDAANSSGR